MFVGENDLPKYCTGSTCINAINVEESVDIDFSQVKQIATCNDKVINTDKGGTTPPGTIPGGGGTGEVEGWFESTTAKVLVGVGVFLLVVIIGVVIYFLSSGTSKGKAVVKTPQEKLPVKVKTVAPKPVVKPSPKPVVKPSPKPVALKPSPKPVVKPSPKPVALKPSPKPVALKPVATQNVTIPPSNTAKQAVGLPRPSQV